jgi:hypothetical protein
VCYARPKSTVGGLGFSEASVHDALATRLVKRELVGALGYGPSLLDQSITHTRARCATQGCWEAFLWYRTGLCRCRFRKKYIGPINRHFFSGPSSFTAVPGRQHNCFSPGHCYRRARVSELASCGENMRDWTYASQSPGRWSGGRPSPSAHRHRAHAAVSCVATYSDPKVANREIRVWHFVIENGY